MISRGTSFECVKRRWYTPYKSVTLVETIIPSPIMLMIIKESNNTLPCRMNGGQNSKGGKKPWKSNKRGDGGSIKRGGGGYSIDSVVRLIWPMSDNLDFLTQDAQNWSDFWVSSQIFMTLPVERFFTKCILKKFGALRNRLVWIWWCGVPIKKFQFF